MDWCLFGAGRYGQRFYKELSVIYSIICFCDNSPEKQGTVYCGIPVIAPSALLDEYKDCNVIVASDLHIDMIWQLFHMGIKKSYIYNMSDRGTGKLTAIDLTMYDSFTVLPNKIVTIAHGMSGNNGSAIIKLSTDGELLFSQVIDSTLTTQGVVDIFTCSLLLSSHHQSFKGKRWVALWHGFPLKSLGLASLVNDEVATARNQLSYVFNERQAICSYSILFNLLMGYSFSITPDKFAITGMPRNDFLFKSDGVSNLKSVLENYSQRKVLLYAPTFRASKYDSTLSHGSRGFIFDMPGFNLQSLDNYLDKNDILLLCKFHPYEANLPKINCRNICLIDDETFIQKGIDFYEILNAVDILITDYSSLYFDFLLLDKPIIFTPVDLENYRQNKGFMLGPYEEWTPGAKAVEFPELLNVISAALDNPDLYARERDHIRKIIHAYTDGNSTQRVIKLIKAIIKEK